MSTEEELLNELREVGVNISSIWDLVNGSNNYGKALPILIRHLKSAEDLRFKEGIVRALAVRDFNKATNSLINEYNNSNDESFKWAVANSLSVIAPVDALDELIEIMGDAKHGYSRQMIAEALGQIGDKASVPVLLKALEDEQIAGHAVVALGKIGNISTVDYIKPFLKSDIRWIRKAAKKAIERIKKRRKDLEP